MTGDYRMHLPWSDLGGGGWGVCRHCGGTRFEHARANQDGKPLYRCVIPRKQLLIEAIAEEVQAEIAAQMKAEMERRMFGDGPPNELTGLGGDALRWR